jgi:exodeoxyribonuclease VII large subunit
MNQSFSLLELNRFVREVVKNNFPDTYWVRAETSDVRRNANGHCYLEFIEKDPVTQNIVARARGVIWANTFRLLESYFQSQTGTTFTSGMGVLIRVSVEFHEQYGYSLTVVDIDPSFTIGEMARNRMLVIRRLEEEGVLRLNKELPIPDVCNRIAVISSATAAGYGDFSHQLASNPFGLIFYTKLFPAVMQGENSEASIIAALEKIYENRELFDAVAIIRGGGATSELNCFDSYPVATNCAQFPLPIVTGIGHERDITVLDMVAHTSAKTPTAVAEFFIDHQAESLARITDLQQRLASIAKQAISRENSELALLSKDVYHRSIVFLSKQNSEIGNVVFMLRAYSQKQLDVLKQEHKEQVVRFRNIAEHMIRGEKHRMENAEQYFEMVSPKNVLKRGYTITMQKGKIVTSAASLVENECIETIFSDGKTTSEIKNIEKWKI